MVNQKVSKELYSCLRTYHHQLDVTYGILLENPQEAAKRLVLLRKDFGKGKYQEAIEKIKDIGIMNILHEISEFKEDVIRNPEEARKNIEKKMLELEDMLE